MGRILRLTARHRGALQLMLAATPALLFTVHISSCTVAGTLGGAVIDELRKDRKPSSVVTIHRGAHVELRLRDGRSLRGRFDGRHDMTAEAYAREWASWRDTVPGKIQFPSPGDSVALTWSGGHICSGRLVAYRIDAVVVDTSGEECSVPPGLIVSLQDASGHSIEPEVLRRSIHQVAMPLSTMIQLQTKTGTIELPLHAVREVEGPAPRGGKIFGFVVGLGADALILSLAVQEANDACAGAVTYSGNGY